MSSLQHKIDFAVIFTVDHSNPNGDPLNGNRPRTDYEGRGEVTDVCLKRKIRDRLMEAGHAIFVQPDDRNLDGMTSLRARAESPKYGLGKEAFIFKKPSKKGKDAGSGQENEIQTAKKEETAKAACAKWFDVRSFGQLFAFKAESGKGKTDEEDSDGGGKGDGISIPIRGPVSIHSAFSVEPVSLTSVQITKSVNSEDKEKRSSDTMGMKHRVDSGTYVFFGSMNPQLAERTGFSDADAEVIRGLLPRLFENDASSARPEGSMAVKNVFWWKHNCKAGQFSSAKVHRSLKVKPDGTHEFDVSEIGAFKPEIIPGF